MSKIDHKYYVMKQAYDDYNPDIVSINYKEIFNLDFKNIKEEGLSDNEISQLKNKSINDIIGFIIGLNSINYQYWDMKGGVFSRYSNNGKVGALAAFDGFSNLWNDYKHKPLQINLHSVKYYFGDIPNKESRLEILKESLNVKNMQKVTEYVLECINNGIIDTNTAQHISKIMPISFEDPYLKKIQLALYEITLAVRGLGYSVKEELTVAADYQLPKVMQAMGLISYNLKLAEKIDNHIELDFNSKEEKAIRAATIIACEAISTQHKVSIPSIDRWLWLARNNYNNSKFHLTKTTAY